VPHSAGAGPRRLRERWIDWVILRHRIILVVAMVATVAAGLAALRLDVDSDLRRLLPTEHRVVRGLEDIERTFGTTGSVNVVIKDGPIEARHAFTDAVARQLHGHPLLENVDYRLPSDFFSEHALYYLADEEMESLDDKIQAWMHYEFCTEAPDNCLTEPDPEAPKALERFVDAKRGDALLRTGFSDRYEREGLDVNVMLLHPVKPPSELQFAKSVTEVMRAEVADVFAQPDQPWSGTDMSYAMVGPYISKADEHDTITRDMVRAGVVAVTGVVFVLLVLFRSMRAVLVLLVPLGCGVVWSLAATWLVLGHLNVMTSMISTVVMGAGIDAGIHFMVRARRERRDQTNRESIRKAFHGLIVPLLVASGTTVAAFLIMASSEFPAFREFGVIAAMGVALCLLSMITVLPALAHLVGIKRHRAAPKRSSGLVTKAVLARPGLLFAILVGLTLLTFHGARRVDFEYNGRALQSDHAREKSGPDTRLISEVFGKDIHAGILVRPTLEEARATLDLARRRHEARKATGNSVVAELFGAPDLLPDVGIDPQQRQEEIHELLEEETVDKLRSIAYGEDATGGSDDDLEGWEDEGDGTPSEADDDELEDDLDGWEDVEGAVPADDDANEPASDASDSTSTDDSDDADDADDRQRLTAEDAQLLLKMLEARPFTIDDLPPILLRKVRSPDGAYGVFAYPDFDAADMRKGVEFTIETSSYLDHRDSTLFVGETTVYAAMFLMLQEEAPVVLGMAAVLIAALVYWQLRSIQQALLTLLPLGLALWWLVGLMGATGLKFTLFNLPILPAILGIGVDNGVYLTDRIRRTKGEVDGLARSLQETGGAIMAAMSTTAIGFAALLVADSAGVRGIGTVAVLGIVLAGGAAVLVLPTLSSLGRERKSRREKKR
jgi:uncharacterized protein